MSDTIILGLTGQTGAGKSTLSRMFADRGFAIINADAVAREAMETSPLCLSDLVLEFSTEVIHPDATLNREKLASICFGDRKKLKRLNEITFPYIIDAIVRRLEDAKRRGAAVVVLDAPTLYESGLDKRCDLVVAVLAKEETRLARILARDGMSEEAALRRIHAQSDDAFYSARADRVIHNDEDLDALRFAFMDLCAQLEKGILEQEAEEMAREEPGPGGPPDAPEGAFDELDESEPV